MKRLLGLDAALGGCSAAIMADGVVLAERQAEAGRGQDALLPGLLDDVLRRSGLSATVLDAVAVTIGPGSFTGLRAALALAHGIALAAGIPVLGVTVAEAMAAALPSLGGRALWVAIDSRRGRIFLDRDGVLASLVLDHLPAAGGLRVAVAGNAAIAVAARLAASGADVMLTDLRRPRARDVAQAAAARAQAALAPRPAQPLYVDPPEARAPSAGLRPAPA